MVATQITEWEKFLFQLVLSFRLADDTPLHAGAAAPQRSLCTRVWQFVLLGKVKVIASLAQRLSIHTHPSLAGGGVKHVEQKRLSNGTEGIFQTGLNLQATGERVCDQPLIVQSDPGTRARTKLRSGVSIWPVKLSIQPSELEVVSIEFYYTDTVWFGRK